MRFKIKLPDSQTYQDISNVLKEQNNQIFVASSQRNLLSTENISQETIGYIEQRGGSVVLEQKYDSESNNLMFCG